MTAGSRRRDELRPPSDVHTYIRRWCRGLARGKIPPGQSSMLRRTGCTMMKRVTVGMLLVAALVGGAVPQVTVGSVVANSSAGREAYSRGSAAESTRGLLCRLLPECCSNQK